MNPMRRAQMRKGQIAGVTLTAMIAAAIVLAACSDNTSAPITSPAAGLTKIEANDTSNTSPPSPGEVQPGSFHGVIYGLAPSGSGPDTMANSVKLQGVRVAAYPYLLELN